MSAYGMKPTFTDQDGYKKWKAEWRRLYETVSAEIRSAKYQVKALERKLASLGWTREMAWNNEATAEQSAAYKTLVALRTELPYKRAMGDKMMTLLKEARLRWANIQAMKQGLVEQNASFPLELGEARNIDFHFNKKHLEFDFVPMWVIKAKGKTFYVNHVDCNVPWTTRETPENPTTKGAIRIRKGSVSITADGVAQIN